MDETFAWLDEMGRRYRRVWVIKSGTHPYFDLQGEVEQWLIDNFLRVRDAEFFSHSSLRAQLYLPEIAVFEEAPKTLPAPGHGGVRQSGAGGRLRPRAPPVSAALPSPLKLYWQVTERPARRYKYIFQVAERLPETARDCASDTTGAGALRRRHPDALLGSGQDHSRIRGNAAARNPTGAGERPLLDLPDVRSRDAGEAPGDEGRGRGAAARRRDGAVAHE